MKLVWLWELWFWQKFEIEIKYIMGDIQLFQSQGLLASRRSYKPWRKPNRKWFDKPISPGYEVGKHPDLWCSGLACARAYGCAEKPISPGYEVVEKWISIRQLVPVLFRVLRSTGLVLHIIILMFVSWTVLRSFGIDQSKSKPCFSSDAEL
jgi:hypothetical protein